MRIPFGAIYTTNITPDPLYGIGRLSLTDFDRALRFGVADGHTLYPAMPFASYANTRPEDVAALYAFFKHGVSAAAVPNRRNALIFPLSMRWPLTFWRPAFADLRHLGWLDDASDRNGTGAIYDAQLRLTSIGPRHGGSVELHPDKLGEQSFDRCGRGRR